MTKGLTLIEEVRRLHRLPLLGTWFCEKGGIQIGLISLFCDLYTTHYLDSQYILI